jgi:hypothetical protein
MRAVLAGGGSLRGMGGRETSSGPCGESPGAPRPSDDCFQWKLNKLVLPAHGLDLPKTSAASSHAGGLEMLHPGCVLLPQRGQRRLVVAHELAGQFLQSLFHVDLLVADRGGATATGPRAGPFIAQRAPLCYQHFLST